VNLSPALVLAFKRPKQLTACLDALIEAGTSKVYISIDGPRATSPEDSDSIAQVIAVVESRASLLDITVRQASVNGGVGQGLLDGISWFFDIEPHGMVIEEDIVVEPSSYRLASRMLHDLEHVSTVGSISLFNAAPRRVIHDDRASWRLSAIPSSWYWGSWRECWQAREASISNWRDNLGFDGLMNIGGGRFAEFWSDEFDRELSVNLVPWETLWLYTHWRKGWLSANTNHNYCINLGYTDAATNSFERPTWYPTNATEWNGVNDPPLHLLRDHRADAWMANQMYGLSPAKVLKRKVGQRLPYLRRAWRGARMKPMNFHGDVD
jgi:hypothetical protein